MEFCNGAKAQKTRMTTLPDRQNIVTMSIRLGHCASIGRTDGQTDGQIW